MNRIVFSTALCLALMVQFLSPPIALAREDLAHTEYGLPMLIFIWPALLMLLPIIIPIKAIIAKKLLDLTTVRGFHLSAVASAFSTIIAIPLTWLILVIGQIFIGLLLAPLQLSGGFGVGDYVSPWKMILGAVLFNSWLDPWSASSDDLSWIAPTAMISLCIPFCFVSIWAENLIARTFISDKDRAFHWAKIANLTSYGLTIILLIAGLLCILWDHAQKEKEYGYIDLTGKLVLRPKVGEYHGFHESAAAVGIHGRWGFINKMGEFIIKPQFQGVGFFSDGLAAAEDNQGKWGFIDKSGQFVIAPKFEDVLNFSEGLAAVNANGLYFFVNNNGDPVIDHRYKDATCFSNGLALVTDGKEAFYIDHAGKRIFSAYGSLICPAYAGFWHHAIKNGYLDESRDIDVHNYSDKFIPILFKERLPIFSEGLAPYYTKRGVQGYMDIHGKEVIPAHYIETSAFSEGLAYVESIVGEPQDSFWKHSFEYIDKSGKTILWLNDIPISSFNNGLAVICTYKATHSKACKSPFGIRSDEYYYIDKNGKMVFGRTFDYAYPFSEGLAVVGEKWLVER